MKGLIANSGFQKKIYVVHFSILDGFCMIILPQNQSFALLRLPEKKGYFMCNLFLKKSNRQNFDIETTEGS
jgi:hypothetical protein